MFKKETRNRNHIPIFRQKTRRRMPRMRLEFKSTSKFNPNSQECSVFFAVVVVLFVLVAFSVLTLCFVLFFSLLRLLLLLSLRKIKIFN